MPDVTLDLGNQYIGSAYSPQVAITETETGHEIDFTFADSEHPGQLKTEGFEVPNYASEEAGREAAEAARAAAESARVAAEEGRMNRELDRVFNENARINAEELREDAETARAAAEQARAAAETARASAEGSRASAEQARTSAESARASAEAGRATAESARVSAEQARATAESARAAAESARVTAEQARQTNTAAAITRADAATAAANTATANAQTATTAAQAATGEAETATDAANAAAALATAAAETVTDAYSPMFTAGAAEGITGGGPTDTAAWTYRACPGTDGPATIESIHGNTVVESGELLSVQMDGIETVGFNQWDEEWEVGSINNDTGQNTTATTVSRSKNYIPVFPSTEYYCNGRVALYFYDADKNYVGRRTYADATTFTTGSNVHYLRFIYNAATMPAEVCINLSDPLRNGEYEPHWKSERTIPAATYFPNGMRSAGSVYDELTIDAAVTRVGAVDLGTLDWETYSTPANHVFRATYDRFPGLPADHSHSALADATMAQYTQKSFAAINASDDGCFAMSGPQTNRLIIVDHSYTDAAAFKAAMNGVILHYAIATPTTTPIDPPLNLTYRVSDFGTERILHTDPTAAPTLVVAYGSTADGIRDAALACIAPVENGKASANYGVGTYLIHGGQLCRVTTAIATGEAIAIGTNVTATTVMAEVLSLVQ